MQKPLLWACMLVGSFYGQAQLINPPEESPSLLHSRNYSFELEDEIRTTGMMPHFLFPMPELHADLNVAHAAPDNMPVRFPEPNDLMPVLPPVAVPFMPMRRFPAVEYSLLKEGDEH